MTALAAPGQVAMPRLSDSMEEGTIVRWLKRTGEAVSRGEVLAEIETDKATMEYEAEADGVIEILATEGETVAVGEPIARLAPPGNGSAGRRPIRRSGPRGRATPVARRLARQHGVDLGSVTPTGRRGQVMKADVLATLDGPARSPEPDPAGDAPASTLSATQRTIARRMSAARATIPDFDVEVSVDMSGCLALREQLRAHVDRPPTLTDMVIKACALALRRHPRVNGSYHDSGFSLHDRADVAIAVAAEDALLVPVVRCADSKSLSAIAATTRELAAKARDRRLSAAELDGATFTVSNLGMFGVSRFTAVIDAPQAAILAVGAVEERAVGRAGEVVLAPMMTATLACDHRIIYGAEAASFLTDVRALLEAPIQMLL